jgi:hypothetical protein
MMLNIVSGVVSIFLFSIIGTDLGFVPRSLVSGRRFLGLSVLHSLKFKIMEAAII